MNKAQKVSLVVCFVIGLASVVVLVGGGLMDKDGVLMLIGVTGTIGALFGSFVFHKVLA